MSDRRIVAESDRMVAWMRKVEDDLAMLKQRKLQGALAMESIDVAEASTMADLTLTSATISGAIEKVTGARLNSGLYVQQARATAGASPTTTTPVDIPGAAISVTVAGTYIAIGAFDVTVSPASNTTATGLFAVTAGTLLLPTGIVATPTANFLDAVGGPIARATVTQFAIWQVTAAQIVGSAAIRQQAALNGAGTGFTFNSAHTGFVLFRANP